MILAGRPIGVYVLAFLAVLASISQLEGLRYGVGIGRNAIIDRSSLGITYLVFAIGLMKLWNWARVTCTWTSIFVLIVYVPFTYAAFTVRNFGLAGMMVFIWLPLAVHSVLSLLYLTRPSVKQHFKQHKDRR